MPAMIIETMTAGPACFPAACPVSTKIPVPMIAPMPSIVRSSPVSAFFRWPAPVSSASAMIFEIGLVAKSDIKASYKLRNLRRFRFRALRGQISPNEIHRNAGKHDHKTRPRRGGLENEQHDKYDACTNAI